MFRCMTVVLFASLLFLGCSRTPTQKVVTLPAVESHSGDMASADPIVSSSLHHANLTIFPISSLQARSEDRFTTLDEGLRAGSVEVFEIGADSAAGDEAVLSADMLFGDPLPDATPNEDVVESLVAPSDLYVDEFAGPQVNRVMVVNRSDKPLYLMPGEIIMGGDQDRCVAEEFVLEPSDQATAIDVFCVEHGRWGGRSLAATHELVDGAMAFSESVSLAASVASEEIGKAASNGQFVASVGSLNKQSRIAVQASKDQDTVWNSVANVNTESGVNISSGAFTGNYVDKSALHRLEPYCEAMHDKVLAVDNVVGVVVAVNGKIHTMDLFESTPLFAKLWPKLLKSYALDAANLADEDDKVSTCSLEAASNFVQESLRADVDEAEVTRGVAITRRSSNDLISFSAADDTMSSGGFGGGGFGGVHTSAFSK